MLFKNTVFNAFERKTFCHKQDKASKDTFFLIHLTFQSNLSLQISLQKLKNISDHRGGGMGVTKGPKSVTNYLNGPLTSGTKLSGTKMTIWLVSTIPYVNIGSTAPYPFSTSVLRVIWIAANQLYSVIYLKILNLLVHLKFELLPTVGKLQLSNLVKNVKFCHFNSKHK